MTAAVKLPGIRKGVLRLKAKTYRLDERLWVAKELSIEADVGARILWSEPGPAILVTGKLTMRDLSLVRSGAWGGLLDVRGRCVAEAVRFEGALGWNDLDEPRPEYVSTGGAADAGVCVHASGSATLTRCHWSGCRAPLVDVQDDGQLTVKGGSADANQPGFRLVGARLSISNFHTIGLLNGVECFSKQGTLRLRRSSFRYTRGDAVSLYQGTTLDARGLEVIGGSIGLRLNDECSAELRECVVEAQSASGIQMSGRARLELHKTQLAGSWAGLVCRGQSEASLDECVVEGNVYGVLAQSDSHVRMSATRVENNQLRGVEGSGLSQVEESGCTLGPHPEGGRLSYDFARWTGAAGEVTHTPPNDVLEGLRRRLEQVGDGHITRRHLLERLPQLFQGDADATWLLERVREARPEFVRGAAASVDALLLTLPPSRRVQRLRRRFQTPELTAPALVPVREFEREGLCCVTWDGPDWLLTGARDGLLERWSLRGAKPWRELTSAPIDLHMGHGCVAVCDRQTAWLFETRTGREVGQWSDSGEEMVRVRVGPEGLEIYSVETTGHPTDRSGYRRRVETDQQLARGKVLACVQGIAPEIGARGDGLRRPKPKVDAPLRALDAEGYLRMVEHEIRWTRQAEGRDTLASWAPEEQLLRLVPLGKDAVAISHAGVHVLRCVSPAG